MGGRDVGGLYILRLRGSRGVSTPSFVEITDADTPICWILDEDKSRGSSDEGVSGPHNTDIFDDEESRRSSAEGVFAICTRYPFPTMICTRHCFPTMQRADQFLVRLLVPSRN